MPTNLETRLQKLEATLNPELGLVCLLVNEGEARNDCVRRHGFDPHESRATFVLLDEIDARA